MTMCIAEDKLGVMRTKLASWSMRSRRLTRPSSRKGLSHTYLVPAWALQDVQRRDGKVLVAVEVATIHAQQWVLLGWQVHACSSDGLGKALQLITAFLSGWCGKRSFVCTLLFSSSIRAQTKNSLDLEMGRRPELKSDEFFV